MRRFRDRRPATFFRRNELFRLAMMVVMACVIGMLIFHSKDPRTWQFFGGSEEEEDQPEVVGGKSTVPADAAASERQSKKKPIGPRSTATGSAEHGPAKTAPAKPADAVPDVEEPASTTADAPAVSNANPEDGIREADDASADETASTDDTGSADITGSTDTAAPPNKPIAVRRPVKKVEPQTPKPKEAYRDIDDRDPEEWDAAKERFENIVDKEPLQASDTPAYWQLMTWQYGQKASDMRKRADKHVIFSQIFQQPQKYRGKLVELKLHLVRALEQTDQPANELGLSTLYELYGYNADSQPNHYILVCSELPDEMPIGPELYEDGTFVGYFLKWMAFEDHHGKFRSAPVLIGQLIWHPTHPVGKQASQGIPAWQWAAGGAALLLAFLFPWLLFLRPRKTRQIADAVENSAPWQRREAAPIESWLEGSEAPFGDREISSGLDHDNNGNGTARLFSDGLDWTEDKEG